MEYVNVINCAKSYTALTPVVADVFQAAVNTPAILNAQGKLITWGIDERFVTVHWEVAEPYRYGIFKFPTSCLFNYGEIQRLIAEQVEAVRRNQKRKLTNA